MKPAETQIETCLRHAPQPAPPGGLKEKLWDQIQLPATIPAIESRVVAAPSWWQRWWPALAPVAASVVLTAWAVVQRQEILTLRDTIQHLQNVVQAATNQVPANTRAIPFDAEAATQNEAAELERLRQRVTALQGEISQLELVRLSNAKLRDQIAAVEASFSQEELDAMNEAKAQAMRTRCINHLKQVGLAVRIYTSDANEVCPPDFLTMSNELNTPKILFCPADTNLPPVNTWAEFATTASSYQYLVAGVTNADTEPQRIMTYCPTHNIFGLCDGSVQDYSKHRYEDCVVERDGKLYLEPKPITQQPGARP